MAKTGTTTYKLKDLLKIKNGKDHKALGNGTIPVYGSGGIMRYADSYLYDKASILLPRKGSLDNIQYCDVPFWTVDTIYYTEVNENLCDAYYLYRYLKLLDLSQLDSGTGVPSMTFDSYYQIEVKIPTLEAQKRIASMLKALDSKININEQINRNLATLAKQLYDYWFVQFDFPNEEGKPYKSSGGKMVWNDTLKKDIPEGWDVLPLFEAISVQYGFPFATEQFTEEITNVPVVRIRDILDGTTSAYSLEDTEEKYRLNEGDVLVGMDGNFHINFWHNNEAYLNQRCVRLRPYGDSDISSIQIMHSISPYIKAMEQNAKGSTVGHLSDKDMKGLYLIQPTNTKNFNPRNTLDRLLSLIIGNKKEILSLTKQRDELLPLLMNGQVSIK